MKKVLMRGAEIELYFGGTTEGWARIEVKTDIAFWFDYEPKAYTDTWKKYTNWAWLNEKEHIYMLFHEKDLMP